MMVAVACLGFAGVSDAQTTGLQVQGTLAGVNCQTGQVVLDTSGGQTTIDATDQSGVDLNGSPIALCSLASYTGAAATATVVPSNNEFVLGQIDVTAQAAVPAPATVSSGTSTLGLALGALAIGALGYLIGKSTAQAPVPVPAYYNNSNYRAAHCQNNNQQWCHR
jgi:hypothetical protein